MTTLDNGVVMKLLRLIILGCMIACLASCSLFSKFSKSDNSVKPTPLATFKQTRYVQRLWSVDLGSGAKGRYLRLMPTVSQGIIYAADPSGTLIALNAQSGRKVWQHRVRGGLSTGPAVADGMVLVGSTKGHLLAFNASNGNRIWEAGLSNEILSAPAAASDIVVAKSIDGKVEAYRLTDGKRLWSYDHTPPNLILRASSSPVIKDGLVVLGFADAKLAVLGLKTGSVHWLRPVAFAKGSSAVDRMVDIDANPIVKDGEIYVVTYQGKLAALSLYNGQRLWSKDFSAYTGMALSNKKVFVSAASGRVYAFNQSDGEALWKLNDLRGRRVTGPAVMGNTVVVGDKEGYLHWLSTRDGHFVARIHATHGPIYAAPLVWHHNVYVVTAKGDLIAYRLRTPKARRGRAVSRAAQPRDMQRNAASKKR
jgi:outer membrane protein assembly factor BamB